MRVLVVTAVPRMVGVLAWFPRALQSIMAQEWEGTLELFMPVGDRPHGTRYDRVTAKYEQARQVALDGGFDAVWFAEYDMVMPPNALKRLTAIDTDIAYGLYVWRRPGHQWSAYTYLDENTGVSLSQMPRHARAAWGTQIEVEGVGQGCTLVRRHVLETISFRREGVACADWFMALDAREKGYRQVCDLGVVCGHMSLTPSPRTYWPDVTMPGLARIEVQRKAEGHTE